MECSRHDRLPARRGEEKEKKGKRGVIISWCVVGCASTKLGKNIRCFAGCGCRLLCLLVQKYLPVMGNGQWAMNYSVRDGASFLHLLLLAFWHSKKYRCDFFLFFNYFWIWLFSFSVSIEGQRAMEENTKVPNSEK